MYIVWIVLNTDQWNTLQLKPSLSILSNNFRLLLNIISINLELLILLEIQCHVWLT